MQYMWELKLVASIRPDSGETTQCSFLNVKLAETSELIERSCKPSDIVTKVLDHWRWLVIHRLAFSRLCRHDNLLGWAHLQPTETIIGAKVPRSAKFSTPSWTRSLALHNCQATMLSYADLHTRTKPLRLLERISADSSRTVIFSVTLFSWYEGYCRPDK